VPVSNPIALHTTKATASARILRAIEKPFEIGKGVRTSVTASIGLSRFPADGTSSEALIGRSDMAMYRVKDSGGNAFELCRAADIKDSRGNP
jgi:GGDEF domain-containing protein